MHLSSEAALDLLEGRLLGEQEAFWKRHLETCSGCAERLNGWRTFAVRLPRRHMKSAPDADLQKAANIFPRSLERRAPRIRAILAAIVFESFGQPAVAGVRGGVAPARQLVMRAEEFDIHIKICGDPDHWQMLGQLLPRNEKYFVSNARLHLMRNGERIDTAVSDDMGEFHFSDVPEGELSLQIDLPNLTVIGALHVEKNL